LFFPWLILRAFVGGLVLLIILFRRRSIQILGNVGSHGQKII
jgi:hypothetical protein